MDGVELFIDRLAIQCVTHFFANAMPVAGFDPAVASRAGKSRVINLRI